jgi:uncharacterized membrane protein
MEMKKNNFSISSIIKSDWYILLIIFASLAFGLYVYPELPAKIPTHWDIHGQINGWSGKTFAVIFFPLLNLFVYTMMLLMPKLDPRKENYSRFSGAYRVIRMFLNIFLALLYLISLLVALGYPIRVDFFVRIAVSLLFILIGNYMGKFQHNYFVGIKTPWTLASEEVWRKTHRMAAPLWVAFGTMGIFLSFFRYSWTGYLQIILFLLMALIPSVYSYLIYQKEKLS